MKAAIIAGTGIYDIPDVQFKEEIVETPYGQALVNHCQGGEADGLIFLARHGLEHHTPPHRINYRANLKALKMLGVEVVLATNAVGSINRQIPPAGLALLTDFLDFTSGRDFTYYDGGKAGLVHLGMDNPYCPALRRRLSEQAPGFGLNLYPNATYVASNGPRFESPAEIRMYEKMGGDVVGMTGIPEMLLARELQMHYAAIAYSINWASGLEETMEFVSGSMSEIRTRVVNLMVRTLREPIELDCKCNEALMVMHPPEE